MYQEPQGVRIQGGANAKPGANFKIKPILNSMNFPYIGDLVVE